MGNTMGRGGTPFYFRGSMFKDPWRGRCARLAWPVGVRVGLGGSSPRSFSQRGKS